MANRDSRLREMERQLHVNDPSGDRIIVIQVMTERFTQEEVRQATDAYYEEHPVIDCGPGGILLLDIVRGEDGQARALDSTRRHAGGAAPEKAGDGPAPSTRRLQPSAP